MPTVREDVQYDPSNAEDILRFAKELKGKTLGEWIIDHENDRPPVNRKGRFGQILEDVVFGIPNNSKKAPDLEDVGIEIKSTPIKIEGKKKVPKERIVLSMINYMTLLEEGWDMSFFKKNGKLLIIFYLYEKRKRISEYKILDAILWEYPEEDLRIIRDDWNVIARMVKEGRAHEISERHTMYLAACRKGISNDKDSQRQPYSDEKALRRAFSLKQSYVGQIWKSADSESIVRCANMNKTFEEEVLDRFTPYVGRSTDEIEAMLGITFEKNPKSRYAILANKMLGVKTKNIAEFEKADVYMKTIRLKADGVPKESMSFPSFDYTEIVRQKWEDSDFYNQLNRRFLFVIYRADGDGLRFENAMFWSMPQEDLQEAERVWKKAVQSFKESRFTERPKMTESKVSHVRPHGQSGKDRVMANDGSMQKKMCFWLNAKYLAEQIKTCGQRKI